MDRELARKNARLGWLLFGLFWLLFAGTFVIAFLYLALRLGEASKGNAPRSRLRGCMPRLRALLVSAAVVAAFAATAVPRAHASVTPPPCSPDSAQQNAVYSTTPPSTGPNEFSTAHFDVWYSSDPSSANYMTETQAGDLAAFAEQAYSAYAALGFPAPWTDASTGKAEIYVIDMTDVQPLERGVRRLLLLRLEHDRPPRASRLPVDWDIFALVEERIGGADVWFFQEAAQWAAAKISGYPASAATDVGPFEVSLDCLDPNYDVGMARCSKNGYENLALSRWPFQEYLAEKFGTGFMLEVLQDGVSAGDSMIGLQNALAAHGSNLTAEYEAYTTKLMVGGWTAQDLDSISIPVSGSAILTGTTTGDTTSQSFSVDHLATRYVEFDRGGGSGFNACYAATLTVTVQIPGGVASQPVFYWNGTGSSPVPLTVNGSTATATVPWDTCKWSNRALLSLPNATTSVDSATFAVSAHLTVDFSTPAASALPPAQVNQYGTPVGASTYSSAPTLSLYGPATTSVTTSDTTLKVVVQLEPATATARSRSAPRRSGRSTSIRGRTATRSPCRPRC